MSSAFRKRFADRDASLAGCLAAAEAAARTDPTDWEARAYRGLTYLFGLKQHAPAELHAREAVRLNPSSATARHFLGCVSENVGLPAEALEHLQAVFRLNPNHHNTSTVLGDIVTCHMILGDHAAAVEAATRLVAIAPGYSRGLQRAAAALALAGEEAAAAEAVARFRKVQPAFSEDYVRATYPFAREADLALFLDGLAQAGAFRA